MITNLQIKNTHTNVGQYIMHGSYRVDFFRPFLLHITDSFLEESLKKIFPDKQVQSFQLDLGNGVHMRPFASG